LSPDSGATTGASRTAAKPAKPTGTGAAVKAAPKNPMRLPFVEKLVVNIGVGEGGEKLVKATKVLEMLTKHKPVKTISKTTNRDWGIKVGMPIGCKVTLRGGDAGEFLKKAFWITQNKISVYSFDREGNFSIGVKDYTDFQGMKYDPDIGIFGMDISVTMRRSGSRVATRRRRPAPVPRVHRLTARESMAFLKDNFAVEVVR
jgi:large subunit ribosomal protein L5